MTLQEVRPESAELLEPAKPNSGLIKFWAVIGAVLIAICIQGWARWLLAGDLHPTPHGPDSIDAWRSTALRIFEVLSITTGMWLAWRYLVKPLIKERTLTFDGMYILGTIPLWFWDPIINNFNFIAAYNTHFVNLGAWTDYIPFFNFANAQGFAEPLVVNVGLFIWWVFGQSLLGCWILRRLKERRPQMSTISRLLVLFAGEALAAFILEWLVFVCIFQAWFYNAAYSPLTIFAGHWYQYPLHEPVAIAVWGVALTTLRYYRDDRGRSWAERGVDDLNVSERTKKGLSFLAINGYLQVSIIIYYLSWCVWAMNADTHAKDAPSYLRDQICGEETDYACPDELVPIPREGSIHITPDDPRLDD